ncbi:ImmA/IrrE family metallo-endopeptidase [Rhodanobacter denitrificans]|uniref:ImmA/IrrE family metallo-endopeptidase n=1 Tax=Rhodanobacter denitrificans TaxID=666685 RepID=A0A368KKD0_9GAMM|nr:ImmA/IrrE family metallo-endopeptidase [Rhodanobacter denitrificans]RCS31576.1 ImmA/IrrE family metallo-endopeptidase [Rhodanobacter denitrificans]
MRPRAAANQLTKVLREAIPPEQWFPVDPFFVARGLGVQVHEDDLGQGIEGAMLTAGKKSAIVINSRIQDQGRRAFTGAHELGHFSLHRNRAELRCTVDNLLDTAPHPANIEQEANEFAMTLLMPIDDFRSHSSNALPSIGLVKSLALRYGTSLTATALRLRESSSKAFALAYVTSGQLKWWWPTNRFRWRVPRGQPWIDALVASEEPLRYNTEEIFGTAAAARLGETLRISGVDMPSYDASLWVVDTPDERRPWEWDKNEEDD